jgi:hypothetical protein
VVTTVLRRARSEGSEGSEGPGSAHFFGSYGKMLDRKSGLRRAQHGFFTILHSAADARLSALRLA